MNRAFVGIIITVAAETMLWAAPFTQGNLVIYRVGDGTTLLTNAGNVVFLDEYTTNGTPVQSIPLPTTQSGINYPVAASGAATAEGLLSLSADGRYLVMGGYATNSSWGTAPLPQSGATNVPRVVVRVDSSGNIDSSTLITNFANGVAGANAGLRSAASTDGSNFWVASTGTAFPGSSNGIGYVTLHSSGDVLQLSTGSVNDRQVNIFGRQLYFSTASGATLRIAEAGPGLPRIAGQVYSNLPGVIGAPMASPYAFVALPLQAGNTNIDTLYVADEGSNVSKWCFSQITTNWSNFGSITTQNQLASPCGTRGITASVSVSGNQTNVTLFITAGCGGGGGTLLGSVVPGGFLYAITDTTGYGGTLTGTLPAPIATAGTATLTNMQFRGIAFAPANTFHIAAVAKTGNNMLITWNVMGGNNYVLQASPGDPSGNYTTNFVDISPVIYVPGLGTSRTNYPESGGATNKPSRYYRARLVPLVP